MTEQPLDSQLNRLRIDRSRKKRRRRLPWKMFVLVVLIALAGVGYTYYKNQRPIEVEVVRPVVEKVDNPGLYPVLTAGGYVVPRDAIEVSSKIIGRVEEIYVDRGDKVKAGDVLLKLEDKELQAQLRLAEAQLQAAKARLAELEAGSRPEEIAAARAALESARATQTNAKAELERLLVLRKQNAVSQQELDRIRAAHDVAVASTMTAQKQLELAELGPRIEQIEAARAQVAQSEANVALWKTQLDYTLIRAPIDGTILDKVAERGELLTNINVGGTRGVKSSAVEMADLTDLQVEIDLNEADLQKARLGQQAEIRLDSVPDKVYAGKVDEIAPQADRQKATVQVKVNLLNPDEQVRPEVNARVTFMEERKAATQTANDLQIWIPQNAIVQSPQGAKVYIIEGNKAESRNVTTGVTGEKGTLIRDGLAGNELLIASKLDQIEEGQAVKATK